MVSRIIDFAVRSNAWVGRKIRRFCYSVRGVAFGKGTEFDAGVFIAFPQKILLGKSNTVNRGVILQGSPQGQIITGDHVVLSYSTQILTRGIDLENFSENHRHLDKSVKIGHHVWICAGAIILPGTVIEDNVVVAAGAVASGVLKSGWIYGCVPAKKIKKINK